MASLYRVLVVFCSGALLVGLATILLPSFPLPGGLMGTSFLVDLLVLGPWLTAGLLFLEREVRRTEGDQHVYPQLEVVLHWGLVVSLIIFAEGVGLHYAANLLSGLYGAGPGSIPYFYDEVVGHWMPYLAMLVGLVCLVGVQLLHPQSGMLRMEEEAVLAAFSIPLGIFVAYSAIEGQTPLLALVSSPLVALLLFVLARRLGGGLSRYPLCFLVAAVMVVTFITMICYGLVFCGWPQPSELFGG